MVVGEATKGLMKWVEESRSSLQVYWEEEHGDKRDAKHSQPFVDLSCQDQEALSLERLTLL